MIALKMDMFVRVCVGVNEPNDRFRPFDWKCLAGGVVMMVVVMIEVDFSFRSPDDGLCQSVIRVRECELYLLGQHCLAKHQLRS